MLAPQRLSGHERPAPSRRACDCAAQATARAASATQKERWKPFRWVMSLWVTPDLSAVERGERPTPYVNYERVDMAALGDFLLKRRIRFPDDAIDVLTTQLRSAGMHPGPRVHRLRRAEDGPHEPLRLRFSTALRVASAERFAPFFAC